MTRINIDEIQSGKCVLFHSVFFFYQDTNENNGCTIEVQKVGSLQSQLYDGKFNRFFGKKIGVKPIGDNRSFYGGF